MSTVSVTRCSTPLLTNVKFNFRKLGVNAQANNYAFAKDSTQYIKKKNNLPYMVTIGKGTEKRKKDKVRSHSRMTLKSATR